jgi:hypothetical protein
VFLSLLKDLENLVSIKAIERILLELDRTCVVHLYARSHLSGNRAH